MMLSLLAQGQYTPVCTTAGSEFKLQQKNGVAHQAAGHGIMAVRAKRRKLALSKIDSSETSRAYQRGRVDCLVDPISQRKMFLCPSNVWWSKVDE
jgi:hypothetical protein